VDIAIDATKHDRARVTLAVSQATGYEPRKVGADVESFAVDVGGKKVQVDLVFTESPEWARWMFHAAPSSAHKGKVRNALLRAVAADALTKHRDVVADDEAGNPVVRVRRSLKNDEGLVRMHRVAKARKDGQGRVKQLTDATEDEIKAALKELGQSARFTMDRDQVLDPDRVAKELFGAGVKADDLLSAEQVAELIGRMEPERARRIVNRAIGHEMDETEVPKNLRQFIDDKRPANKAAQRATRAGLERRA
jgi:hypothetical protein